MQIAEITEKIYEFRAKGYRVDRIHMTRGQLDSLCDVFGGERPTDYQGTSFMGIPVSVSDTFALISTPLR